MIELLFYGIASFFNIFCQGHTIILSIILGYIWVDSYIFSHVTYLLLTSFLLNSALKMTFQVPLNPGVGEGFSFPSGHMQSSIVFYGWIMMQMRLFLYKEWSLYFILMSGIGYSLIYFGYHDLRDILGACVVGPLFLSFYWYLVQTKNSTFSLTLFLLNTLLLFYIFLHHFEMEKQLISYLILMGMLSSQFFIEKKRIITFYQKIWATLFSILFFVGVRALLLHFKLPTHLSWLLLCFVVPLVINHSRIINPFKKG